MLGLFHPVMPQKALELLVEVAVILDALEVVPLSHPLDVQNHKRNRQWMLRENRLRNGFRRTDDFAVAAEGTGMRIKAVAVATERDGPCAPCGACRQVIFEFGPDALILFRGQSGTQQMEITELLPEGFRLL